MENLVNVLQKTINSNTLNSVNLDSASARNNTIPQPVTPGPPRYPEDLKIHMQIGSSC